MQQNCEHDKPKARPPISETFPTSKIVKFPEIVVQFGGGFNGEKSAHHCFLLFEFEFFASFSMSSVNVFDVFDSIDGGFSEILKKSKIIENY